MKTVAHPALGFHGLEPPGLWEVLASNISVIPAEVHSGLRIPYSQSQMRDSLLQRLWVRAQVPVYLDPPPSSTATLVEYLLCDKVWCQALECTVNSSNAITPQNRSFLPVFFFFFMKTRKMTSDSGLKLLECSYRAC